MGKHVRSYSTFLMRYAEGKDLTIDPVREGKRKGTFLQDLPTGNGAKSISPLMVLKEYGTGG